MKKTEENRIPIKVYGAPGDKEKYVHVMYNFKDYLIEKNTWVEAPQGVYQILKDMEIQVAKGEAAIAREIAKERVIDATK